MRCYKKMNNIPVEDFEFDDTTHIETSPHKVVMQESEGDEFNGRCEGLISTNSIPEKVKSKPYGKSFFDFHLAYITTLFIVSFMSLYG